MRARLLYLGFQGQPERRQHRAVAAVAAILLLLVVPV